VLRLEAGELATALAAELGVRRKLLYAWAKACREHGVAGFSVTVVAVEVESKNPAI
jgi:transposase-like protein